MAVREREHDLEQLVHSLALEDGMMDGIVDNDRAHERKQAQPRHNGQSQIPLFRKIQPCHSSACKI